MARAKKSGSRKAAARKPSAKRAAPKKAAKKAGRSPVRKSAAKKGPARKTGTKAAKKTTGKKVTARKATGGTKKTAKKAGAKRAPNEAFMKAMMPDQDLAAVVGSQPLPRTEITKRIWAYIKKNNLQDPQARRNIIADDKLKKVFGGKGKVTMFEMTKHVNNHLT